MRGSTRRQALGPSDGPVLSPLTGPSACAGSAGNGSSALTADLGPHFAGSVAAVVLFRQLLAAALGGLSLAHTDVFLFDTNTTSGWVPVPRPPRPPPPPHILARS